MRGGHLEAALVAVLADREVEHLGADLAEVDDVRAGVGRAPDRGRRDLGRREAHVAPDRHHLRLERGDVSAGECVCTLGVELVWHDSAHVVCLEHGGRQHRRMSLVTVSIRPLQVRDADTLAALYTANREFLEPFDPPRPEGFATSAAQRRELKALEQERAADRLERFLIQADGEPAGVISVSRITRGPFQNAGLGYWVSENMNGRGVATRAVGLVCEWGFGQAGFHRLEAATLVDNIGLADRAPPQRLHRDRPLAQVSLHQRRLARPHPVRPHRRGLTPGVTIARRLARQVSRGLTPGRCCDRQLTAARRTCVSRHAWREPAIRRDQRFSVLWSRPGSRAAGAQAGRSLQAARSLAAVRVRCSGMTLTSASTGMKFVSPFQRGTTCRWM